MNDYNRKHEDDWKPYQYVLLMGLAVPCVGFLMARCEPEPLISAEKSYNDQRYAKQLQDQQEAAIAKSLRRVAKEKAREFLSAEDEAIDGFWPGQGRRKP